MMCKWDEAYTEKEMLEETGYCKECKLKCNNSGKERNMEELKPCPFCGENGEEIQDRSYYLPNNIYIGIFYCRNCGGAIIDTDKNHSWLDRAKLWNNRFCADGERE